MPLLVEGGPEELGIFTEASPEGTAAVAGRVWQLHFDSSAGATATLPDGTKFRAPGDLGRSKEIEVALGNKRFFFVNETRGDWIIDDAERNKIGQFSGGNSGVRRSILEFEPDVELNNDERAGLSWFVRLILESRLGSSGRALLWTLVLFTVIGILSLIHI